MQKRKRQRSKARRDSPQRERNNKRASNTIKAKDKSEELKIKLRTFRVLQMKTLILQA